MPLQVALTKLSLLNLALASALAAMAALPAVAATIDSSNSQTSTYAWSSGDLTITSTGSISAAGSTKAVGASGSLGTLSNSGTIGGANGTIGGPDLAFAGIRLLGATIASLLNNNGGVISGRGSAIYNGSTITSLVNESGGTIGGGSGGISNFSGIIGTLSNSGLITGGIALAMHGTSSIGSFINAGTLAGNILNTTSNSLSINGSAGSGYGTLTGRSGGIAAGDIGTITSSAGVSFAGGNQLLNDHIVADTVSTAGGALQVNNRISVTGDYNQSLGATLQIGVTDAAISAGTAGDTGYGRLTVSGSAVIAAGSAISLVKLNNYAFANGQRFIVVVANSMGTNYNASSLLYSAAGYSGPITGTSVSDGANLDLVLTLGSTSLPSSPSSGITNLATNPNSAAALGGLYRYGGINAGLLSVYNPALALGSATQANRAGAQLNPTALLQAAAKGSDAASFAVLNVAGNRLDGLRLAPGAASGVSTGEHGLDPALWGQFFGGAATQDDREGISGYHANYRGLLIGGDLQVADSWRAGGLFSYAKTNVSNDGDNTGSTASVNSYGLTTYAGYNGKPWYVNLMAGMAQQQYSTTRVIGFTGFNGVAYGSFNGLYSTASVQAGYPLALSDDTTLTPLAGLIYSRLRQNGYTESGGNGAALKVDSATTTSLKGDIGARLEYRFDTSYGVLTPSVQLRWRHEFQNSRLNTIASFAADSSGSTSFATMGATPVRNTGTMALGATLMRSKNLSLEANYALEAGQGYIAQTADVRLRYQF